MTVKDASVVLFPIHYNDLSSKNKCCYHICSVYCNAACSVLVLRQWGKARSRRGDWHKEQHYSLRYSLHHSHILCNLSLLSPNCVRLQIIKCPCLNKPPWELNRGNTCTALLFALFLAPFPYSLQPLSIKPQLCETSNY